LVYGRTVDEAKQNIANWYQYHRRRSFVSKNAIGSVIDGLPDFRYGLSLINDHGTVFVEMPATGVTDYTSHNASLLNTFYSYEWESQGTPLRRGLEVAGRYYTSNGAGSNNFGKGDPVHDSCQQNFTVLFTDGYYNGDPPRNTDFAIADEDGDGLSDSLADVAMAYYENDLSALADNVPTTPGDPAVYQHMVTFTVAFGVTGELVDTDNDGWPDQYADGTAMPDPLLSSSDWGTFDPETNADLPEKIDDMWHAAFNSRGEYVAATRPSEVVDALEAALKAISDRTSSASSVALSSGFLGSDTQVYQARFFSGDWSGELLAYPILAGGQIASSPSWEAGSVISAMDPATRAILTINNTSGAGVPFRFPSDYTTPSTGEIDADQISNLLTYASSSYTTAQTQAYGQAVLDYLRGNRSNEGTGYSFRNRSSVLGDIVHSDPIFVDEPKQPYPSTWVDRRYPTATQPENGAAESYNAFRTRLASRTPMVWFGANDGMIHGLDARATGSTAGQELLAYVPGVIYENLAELPQNDYTHRYYVDGGTSVIDAYVSSAWRTVLGGSLGGGGQGIFTLDITDPATFSESNASSIVMWEFSDADDADLGYTYSQPAIVRLHNGKWAAIFGNGYNATEADGNASTTGNAVLFIVDLETGAVTKKFDTGKGMSADPTGAGRANGLSAVSPIDVDGDFIYDYVYAGDLFGNVWKFDITSNDTSKWVIDGPGSTANPIFTATDGESTPTAQPITSLIQVGFAPDGRSGVMLYFGTGKYLEVGDNSASGQATQTFYGLWDNFDAAGWSSAISRSELQEQKILEEIKQFGEELRVTSTTFVDWTTKKGWFMDLVNQGETPQDNEGERVVSDPILRVDRIVFTTLLPSVDPCEFGGSGWLMVLDAFSGARLQESPFDLNGDGVFTTSDFGTSGSGTDVPVSGKRSKIGIIPTPGVISTGGGGPDYLVQSGSSGSTASDAFNPGPRSYGRQSWREIRE